MLLETRAAIRIERLIDIGAIDAANELIEHLDAITPDFDLEAEEDCCSAQEDYGSALAPSHSHFTRNDPFTPQEDDEPRTPAFELDQDA